MKTVWYLQWLTIRAFLDQKWRCAYTQESESTENQKSNTRYREKTPRKVKNTHTHTKKNPRVDSSQNFPHAKKHRARLLKTITKKNPKSKHQIWKKTSAQASSHKTPKIPVSWKPADVSSGQQFRSVSDQTSARAHTQESQSTENQKSRHRTSQKDPRTQEKHKNPRVDSSKNFPHAKNHRARLLHKEKLKNPITRYGKNTASWWAISKSLSG